MGIFSGSKNKDELALVFHIGSSFVNGVLFSAQKSGTPKIIFSANEPIQIEREIEVEKFLSSTIKSLEVVVKKIYESKMGVPKKIFCVLSSHWCFSQARTISLKKNTPFLFTEKLADELIKKEIKLFEEEHSINSASDDNLVRIIELKNIKIMLNGYETQKPLKQKAKDLEMTIYLSMSEEGALRKIEGAIAKYFHFEQMRFSSFALSSFAVVRDMYTQQENFLIVDIGGEVTDILMVKKNTLRESISFPLGRNFLTRGVSSRYGCTLEEANSLISLLKDGHAEATVAKKVSKIMSDLQTEWLNRFQESLVNLSNDISIPSLIYLVMDKDLADFFSGAIKNEQFSQYTLTESKFEVVSLNAELLKGMAVCGSSTICDASIIVDSIYINRFLINSALPRRGGVGVTK